MKLESKRLLVEPPDYDDAELFAEWLSDPEITKYSEQRHKKHNEGTQADYWESIKAPSFVRTIHVKDPEGPIGSISAHIDLPNGIANVGIMIGDKTVWRHGYGYEAWECVCDHLLHSYNGIRKIEAGCMFANKPMLRIFKKYEMFFEGGRRNHFLIDGGTSDMVLYGKFAP